MATTVADADVAVHVDASPFARELRKKLEPIVNAVGKRLRVPIAAEVSTTVAERTLRRFRLRESKKPGISLKTELPSLSLDGGRKGSGIIGSLTRGFRLLGRSAVTAARSMLRTFGIFARSGIGAVAVLAVIIKTLSTLIGVALTMGAVLVGVAAGFVAAFAIAGSAVAVFAGVAIPVFLKIFEAVSGGEEAIKKLPPALQEAAREVGKLKKAFSDFVKPLQGPIASIVATFARLGQEVLPLFSPIVKSMTTAVGAFAERLRSAAKSKQFASFLNTLEHRGPRIFTHLAEAALQFGRAIAGIVVALGPFAERLSAKLSRVATSFAEFVESAEGQQKIRDFVAYIEKNLPGAVAGIKDFALTLKDVFTKLSSKDVQEDIEDITTVISALATGLNFLAAAFDKVGAAISKLIEWYKKADEAVDNFMDKITPGEGSGLPGNAGIGLGSVNISTITNSFEAVLRQVRQLPSLVAGALTGLGPAIARAFTIAFNFARRSIGFAITGILSLFRQLPFRILGALSNLGTTLFNVATSAMQRLGSAFSSGINWAVGLVRALSVRVRGVLFGLAASMFSAGARIVSNIASGISAGIGAVVDAMRSVASAIARNIPGSPVQEGPLKVLNRGYAGKQIVAMLAEGMLSELNRAQGASSRLAASLTPRVGPFASRGASIGRRSSGGSATTTNNIYVTPVQADPMQVANSVFRQLAISGGL